MRNPEDLQLTSHAQYRMIEHGIPEKAAKLLFSGSAYVAQVWRRSYNKLTRQELAEKDLRYVRIVREPKPTRYWWVAYQDDETIITVMKILNSKAKRSLVGRLVDPEEIDNIKVKAPVLKPEEVEPRLTSLSQLSKNANLKEKEVDAEEVDF